MNFSLVFPELMKHRLSQLGDRDSDWFENLDVQLDTLQQRWQIILVEQLHGGTEALVFSVKFASGDKQTGPAVLKLGIPGSLSGEIRTLQLASGVGYVRVLAEDAASDALLMAKLGSRLADARLSITSQIELICTTLQMAWRTLDDARGLMTGSEKAAAQEAFITEGWGRLQPGFPISIRDRAIDFARARRAADESKIRRLIHGDAHIWNTLEDLAAPGQYKFVDPDGLYAEPALDLGISMREWKAELLDGDPLQNGQKRCELLADLTGVDAQAIWQWGFIEHVSCGLLDLQLGDSDSADQHLSIASHWLSDDAFSF